jgi:UDP-N-acetylmuramoylalanine--D-glutamate ligase
VPYKNTTVTVIGAARSGLAVARLLKNLRAHVFVSDSKPAKQMREASEALEAMGVPFEFGKHSAKVQESEIVVLSPGVPDTTPVVRLAAQRGKKIISEIEVAGEVCKAPIVAITGTNGKTTTTALVHAMVAAGGRKAIMAGNIGTAFSSVVEDADEKCVVVLEVSSFQLDHIDAFRPKVAVLLNITPDHLDRYDSFEEYVQSKFRVAENQKGRDVFVYNHDDATVRTFAETLTIKTSPFSLNGKVPGAWLADGMIMVRDARRDEDVVPVSDLKIRGRHNVANAMAALLAARAVETPLDAVREALRTFRGVEHRIEFVRTLGGISYYNDSKATNVDSVRIALESFSEKVVLIMGGRDKEAPYAPLRELVRNGVAAIVLIGEGAHRIENELGQYAPCVHANDMADAVEKARANAARGESVLLSPACASYDMFDNFEHRGRAFKECVVALRG